MTAKAYVSYSWTVETVTGVVDEIQRLCKDRKIELVLDRERVNYADSIPNFMRRIGSARWVFVVLSPEYFKSPYCMYELLKIFEADEFVPERLSRRILPVLPERAWLDDARRNDLLEDLGDYWKTQAETELEQSLAQTQQGNAGIALDQQKRALFVAEVRNRLSDFVGYFAERNLPAILPLPSNALIALVARIPVQRTLKEDPDFVAVIKARMGQLLDHAEVRPAVQAAVGDSEFAGNDAVEAIAGYLAEDGEKAIDQILSPAYTHLRQALGKTAPKFDALWEQARELLGCVLLLAVREQWIAASGLDPATESQFEIAVQTPFGVEIVSARLRQKPRLRLESSAGKAEVNGAQRILPPLDMPSGWGNGTGANPLALNRILVEVWNSVFPESAKPGTASLSDTEKEILNDTLRKRESKPNYHYYLQICLAGPTDEAGCRLLCAEAARQLEALPIIYMGFADGTARIFGSTEIGLMNSAREFLQIPYQD